MYPDASQMLRVTLSFLLLVSTEAFFLKWGSDASHQVAQKSWIQPVPPSMSPAYRYYSYNPYEQRKMYQMPYSQPEAPIPISVPAGASLTPVSLQHVQLVPCMCPVAPEEAEKLKDQVGPGPYLAQTYSPQTTYSLPQQITVAADNTKTTIKQ